MKRLFLSITISLLFISSLSAQSTFRTMITEDGKLYFMPNITSATIKMPEVSYKESYTPVSPVKLDMQLMEWQETNMHLSERPMDMQVLSGAYKPFFDAYTLLYLRTNPMALDFYEAYSYPLSENTTFVASGLQSSWPGAGGINTVSGTFAWSNDKWSIWAEGFAGRYFTPYDIAPGLMMGATAGVDYQAADWLKLRSWGQYTFYDHKGRDNMFLYLDNRHKSTSVGGAMEFKVSENFGFGVGVQYNYNPMRNRWESEKLFYPVIKTGNSRINISPGISR